MNTYKNKQVKTKPLSIAFVVITSCFILQTSCGQRESFKHAIVDDDGPDKPYAKIIGDIDKDGFIDIAIGGREGPLVWYKYPDWTKHVISEGGYRTVDGEAGDMDGDGDLDIVMGGLVWYENPLPIDNPADGTWEVHRVAVHPTHDVELGDLDGDNDLDIVTRSQSDFGKKRGNEIHVWMQGEQETWLHSMIECPHGESIKLADIDKDENLDIVIGGIWYENTQGDAQGDWIEHKFADWHPSATVETADINDDGRLDVVLTPSELKDDYYKISWFEAPDDPKTDIWIEHVLIDTIECVIHGLQCGDMNEDGEIDIVYAEMHQGKDPDEVVVLFNRGQGASWDKHVLSDKGSHLIRVADVGNDKDLDLIGANHASDYQAIELWENLTN